MSSQPNTQDWLIHECQACGSPMKIRAHLAVAGARISCPVCQSPVVLHAAGGDSPEFRVDLPERGEAPRRSEVFGRRDAEFSAKAPQRHQLPPSRLPSAERAQPAAEEHPAAGQGEADASGEVGFLGNLKHTSEYESRRKVRVKKKRKAGLLRPEEVSDWDTLHEQLPEAAVAEDPWIRAQPLPEEVVHESESQYVVSEARDDGGVMRRVKRVKKRRLLTLAREFFRRLTFTMRFLIVSMVVLLAGWAVWSNWDLIRAKYEAMFNKEEAERARPPQLFLTSQDENGAVEVIQKYMAARTIDEKLAWVRLPERVRPMMTAWYKDHSDPVTTPGEVLDRSKIRAGDGTKDVLYLVKLDMEVAEADPLTPGATRKSRRWIFVEEIGSAEHRTYRVDWEMTVRHQPMTWEKFRTERPTKPVAFRVMLRGGDYYNHEFTDEKKWAAVHLYYPDPFEGENFLFHGYLEQGTQAWRDLNIFTVPGNAASYILRLRYPQGSLSADQVIVDSVEHTSWFYTETDMAKAASQK